MTNRIYISGKISGLDERQYKENFYYATVDIIKNSPHFTKGSTIINPLCLRPFLGWCEKTETIFSVKDGKTLETKKKHWSEFYKENWINFMITDLYHLRKCTHIAMQKNWIDSKGAWLEYGYAKFILKIPVIFL